MTPFTSLFRFRDERGEVHYGEAGASSNHTLDTLVGRDVSIFRGGKPWDEGFVLTDEKRKVSEVLCPLPQTPIFMCVGLNYKQHAQEAKVNGWRRRNTTLVDKICQMSHGEYPVVFTKPPDALAGPFDTIKVPAACLNMDYEAELCLVIGKDCRDFSPSNDPSEYILGYTAGNDVSSRYWQNPERSGGQHGYAKSFDKFAPIGPVITSPPDFGNLAGLRIQCFVNGEKRQSGTLDDLIFSVPAVLAHLSQGTTLRKGTVIMTGTPSGVAAFMKPPAWLKDGDVVEVHIDRIGTMRNIFSIEKA